MVRLSKQSRGFIKAMSASERKDLAKCAQKLYFIRAITEERYAAIVRVCMKN